MSTSRPQFIPGYPVPVRPVRTAAARVSVACGILSIFFGMLLYIPLTAIITGIVALARGTALTGRAVTGLILGATFGPPWFGFVYLCVYMYTHNRG